MFIQSLTVKNFRCFPAKICTFNSSFVILRGANGAGKTSLLEALHYACYLRSFRTRIPRELISFGQEAFSVTVACKDNNQEQEIHVGCSARKRLVKINNTAIESYKDLMAIYKIITMTDDDLLLIKGSPENRRLFLDQALIVSNPSYNDLLRTYNKILNQRNALLNHSHIDEDSYTIWTEQLISVTAEIRKHRRDLLKKLQEKVNYFIYTFFKNSFALELTYKEKECFPALHYEERKMRRTLWGAHLDDYVTLLKGSASRLYASRGQQQLIALLLKLSQPVLNNAESCVFLIDDALSALDNERLGIMLDILMSYKSQVIMATSRPLEPTFSLYEKYNPTYLDVF